MMCPFGGASFSLQRRLQSAYGQIFDRCQRL